jgi:hypothetical protein
MKKIIPLIFSVLSVITSNAQAVGGWGTCEFADVATMNAFAPSTNAYDCKKVFVQATNDHYYWDGIIWVLVTDDQNASEVPFTPVGTIVATDVQAAIAEIEPDIYGSIDVHDDVDVTTTAPSNGDVLTWDGSNFVPSSGGSSDNIYNTDGTLDANREVSLGNFDLEFNSTGTGDFFVSDNGTIAFAVEDDHVGIGIASPTNPLHIYESTGTPASATNGTIFLEKGDSGGSQSIVFESNVNAGSDYAYIEYSDDGSGNGSTTENSLLVIGVANDDADTYQDDIAIMPSGYLGVGTTSPDAFFDVDGGNVRFSDYGGGTITGTVTQILGVDVNGDVIEVDPSTLGGSSSNAAFGTIYIADGDEVETSLTEDVPTKANGTTTLINANNVISISDNSLRYTGSNTQTFFVSCNISSRVDENRRQIYYSIRKNGADVPSINSATHYREDNSDNELNSTTITGTVELSTNDSLELWIENVEDDEDVTVWFMNMSMFSIEGGGSGGGGGSSDNFYTADGALGEDRVVTLDGNSLTFEGTEDIVFQADGDVGIGTSTPDRKLDVEGGQVRFSDYGTGTYEDTTAVYLLGVEADGDIIEMNTAKNSRIFYPPAVAVTANSIATDLEIDLHDTYVDLFEGSDPSFIKSTSAPGAIPTYDEDELYYYILNYDTSIFANIEIDDNGLMTYDVIAVPSDNCSFINVVFVIKEP